MRYLPLLLSNLRRKKIRTVLTISSVNAFRPMSLRCFLLVVAISLSHSLSCIPCFHPCRLAASGF